MGFYFYFKKHFLSKKIEFKDYAKHTFFFLDLEPDYAVIFPLNNHLIFVLRI